MSVCGRHRVLATPCLTDARTARGRVQDSELVLIFLRLDLLAVAASMGAGLAWMYGLPIPSVILATAPGGIAEMCITAKVLQLGVPLVTAAQVTRVLVLVTGTGTLFKWAHAIAVKLRKSK